MEILYLTFSVAEIVPIACGDSLHLKRKILNRFVNIWHETREAISVGSKIISGLMRILMQFVNTTLKTRYLSR
jgi:hypothetical protein